MRYIYIALALLISNVPLAKGAEATIQKVVIYYIDPTTTTILPLSVDAVIKSAENRDSMVSVIEIQGKQALRRVQDILEQELKHFPSPHWIHNSLDARIVCRFYIDSEYFLQLTCQSATSAQWNNIEFDAPNESRLNQIFDLLPRVLYQDVMDPQF